MIGEILALEPGGRPRDAVRVQGELTAIFDAVQAMCKRLGDAGVEGGSIELRLLLEPSGAARNSADGAVLIHEP